MQLSKEIKQAVFRFMDQNKAYDPNLVDNEYCMLKIMNIFDIDSVTAFDLITEYLS